MKIRIISDLHLDVNRDMPFSLNDKGEEIFTIIAGGISSDTKEIIEWVKANVKKGIIIAGSDLLHNEDGIPLEQSIRELKDAFPIDGDVAFLENEMKIVEGIAFYGGMMGTDFSILGRKEFFKYCGSKMVGEYEWGYVEHPEFGKAKMKYKYMIKIAKEFKSNLRRCITKNRSLPFFVISHFCPSLDCFDNRFNNSNAMLSSNMEQFIKDNYAIKIWACGRNHRQPHSFNINQCEVIMNTRGYQILGECKDFDKDFILEV